MCAAGFDPGLLGYCDKAERLAPDDPNVHRVRAIRRSIIVSVDRSVDRKALNDGVREDFDKWVELAPKDPEAFIFRGRFKWFDNDAAASIDDFVQAIALDPKNAVAYANKAGAEMKMGSADRALADALEALSLAPGQPLALDVAARAYLARGEFAEALEKANAKLAAVAAEDTFGKSAALELRGNIYLKQGATTEAGKDFSAAIALVPRSSAAAKGLDVIAGRHRATLHECEMHAYDDPQGAIRLCSEVIERQGETSAYQARANRYTQTEEFERAVADYKVLVEREPNNAGHFFGLASVYSSAGRFDLALPAIERAGPFFLLAGKISEFAQMYRDTKVRILTGLHRDDEALSLLNAAIRDKSNDPTALWHSRAQIEKHAGDLAAARADAEAAAVAGSKLPTGHAVLGSVLAAQGLKAEAIAELKLGLGIKCNAPQQSVYCEDPAALLRTLQNTP